MHNSTNEPLSSVLRRSYDIEKAFKFIAEVVGNNMVPQSNQNSTIPTIRKNIGKIPRVGSYSTNQKIIIPPNKFIKPTSVDLEKSISRSPKISEKFRPVIPVLPVMPTFREIFNKNLNKKIQHIFYPKGNKMSIYKIKYLISSWQKYGNQRLKMNLSDFHKDSKNEYRHSAMGPVVIPQLIK